MKSLILRLLIRLCLTLQYDKKIGPNHARSTRGSKGVYTIRKCIKRALRYWNLKMEAGTKSLYIMQRNCGVPQECHFGPSLFNDAHGFTEMTKRKKKKK